jgi:hypothetical protein
LEDEVKLFWIKVWKAIKKYWQIFLGLFLGLGVALKLWWQLRAQKKVLDNEIKTGIKIQNVEKAFAEKVKVSTDNAIKTHDERVKIANNEILENTARIKEEFDKRVLENSAATNEDLAHKVADTFGVDIILPEDDKNEE